jgi:hypothetical protein
MTALVYKIDSTEVKDPIGFEWQPPVVIGVDHLQKPMYSAFRSAMARFNALTAAQFGAWLTADNGAYHTVQCPTPSGSTVATYSNIIIRLQSGQSGPLGLIYGASFLVERLVP